MSLWAKMTDPVGLRDRAPEAGRSMELALLASCWREALAGRAQLVLMTGAGKTGRSTLAGRFAAQASEEGEAHVVRCSEAPDPPVLDAVARLIRLLAGCAPDAGADRLSAGLERLAGPFPEPAAVAALLGHIIGLDTGYAPMVALEPAPLRQAAFAALGDVLLARADARPLFLVLDDLQAADPGSRDWFTDFILRLGMATDAQRLMILAIGAGDFAGKSEADAVEMLSGGGLGATLLDFKPMPEQDVAPAPGPSGGAPAPPDPARSFREACQGAERARAACVPAVAARLYSRALDLLATLGSQADPVLADRRKLRLGQAEAFISLGRIEDALDIVAAVEHEFGPTFQTWCLRGMAQERRDEVTAAFESYLQALERARGAAALQAKAKTALADLRRRMGRFAEAIQLAEEAKKLHESLDLPAEKALVHGVLGICHIRRDDLGKAQGELEAALALRREVGDPEGIANCLNSLGILQAQAGNPEQAETDYREALRAFRRLGNPRRAAMVLNNMADLACKSDDLAGATAHLMEAQRLARQVGNSTEYVTTTGNLAEILLKRGNPREALRLAESCHGLALRIGQTESLAELHDLKGRALLADGDKARARHEFGLALDAAERAGNAGFARKLRDRLARP